MRRTATNPAHTLSIHCHLTSSNSSKRMQLRNLLFCLASILCVFCMFMFTGTKVAAQTQTSYTVQTGDTLSAIAEHFHVSIQLLAEMNHIDDPNVIEVGEILRIPSSADALYRSAYPTPTGWEADHSFASPHLTLGQAITQYLQGRSDQVSIAVWNLVSGHHFYLQQSRQFDTASIVKVAIMATLLHNETATHTPLTKTEQSQMIGMIEYSDNDDATALWNEAGQAPGIQAFLNKVGLHNTVANVLGYWGLTETSTADQIALLHLFIAHNALIGSAESDYALTLMEHVVAWEDWGISDGPAPTATVALKNGWLPINDNAQDWAINSVGYVQGSGRRYLIAVLSNANSSESYGITSVEQVSRLVWQALGSN